MEEIKSTEIPFLGTVGMMLTFKCSIACPHCIVQAGPHRTEEMSLPQALQWVDDIAAYDEGCVKGISLTGGEPFYNRELARELCRRALQHGLIVSVVTNAFWAETREQALNVLSELKGLHLLSLSTDADHQLFIGIENIRNAIWAARKLGLQYNVAMTTEDEEDPTYKALVDNLLDIVEPENIQSTITIPAGRSVLGKNARAWTYSPEPSPAACSMASYPILFPNGDVIACIGPPITFKKPHPLYLGNLNEESLKSIFDRADGDALLHAIRVFGPAELLAALNSDPAYPPIRNEYIAELPCDVCIKLFSDPAIVARLAALNNDADFREKVAYGRFYYLSEDAMAKEYQNPDIENIPA
jgi:MoaA/NifB/PqqE/SkfB family radical SAM enzyme